MLKKNIIKLIVLLFRSFPKFSLKILRIFGYRFFIASSEDMLKRIAHFRYKIYLDEGYIEKNDENIFLDKYDPSSINFYALDKKESIVGILRLTLDSPVGLPVENYFNIQNFNYERENSAEPSRFAVEKSKRGGLRIIAIGLGLMALNYSKENGVNQWVVTIPEKLVNSFSRDFGLFFSKINCLPPTDINLNYRKEIQGYFNKKELQPFILKLK